MGTPEIIHERIERLYMEARMGPRGSARGPAGLSEDAAAALIQEISRYPWEAIFLAGRLREERFGSSVDACSIINAKSGNCPEDCAFCAQSAHHDTDAEVYPLLAADEIVAAAKKALEKGVRRFCIVTSGRAVDSGAELSRIARAVEEIAKMGMMPCATLGAIDVFAMRTLRDAGLNRLHHNIETSRSFFPRICNTHGFDDRLETLSEAAGLGLSLCSGGILGMGESLTDRAEMAFTLRDVGVDSVPINFLMPIPGTPMEGAAGISPLEALLSIALFRFILPDKEIRVCGGRTKGLAELHPLMFLAGANGMLTGDYLTTTGRGYDADLGLLAGLGLRISYGQ